MGNKNAARRSAKEQHDFLQKVYEHEKLHGRNIIKDEQNHNGGDNNG